jgi:signal transduction protein with GAF and PtsI domain
MEQDQFQDTTDVTMKDQKKNLRHLAERILRFLQRLLTEKGKWMLTIMAIEEAELQRRIGCQQEIFTSRKM